jgi:subtilisin family serine protease
MSGARATRHSIAIGAAALIVLAAVGAPAQAANPARTPLDHLRPARPGWDLPVADDPGRLIVTFRPGTSTLSRRSAIAGAGATTDADLAATPSVTVHARTGTAAVTLATLQADERVLRVGVDHRRYREADPTGEPGWRELWGLDNTGQDILQGTPGTGGTPDADIDGRQALGITTGSANTVVAVIDDGVDFSHPDLAARAWTNPGESGGAKETNGIDDDANGYVDDVHGWDFCHDDNTVHDFGDDYHGTHVAGTIAASLDHEGIVGVAPGVSIMALKFLGNDESCGYDSMAIKAIAYAKSFGVRIANASWGAEGRPQDAPDLYHAIATSGMLFVAAAGNSSSDNDDGPSTTLPASFDLPNIVSVGAIDDTGALTWFSNYGKRTVDLVAPGESILSALPADEDYPDPGWGWLDGTSMAAPHVTGTAALVASYIPGIAADPVALNTRLLGSGKAAPATAGSTVTGRIVDAYRALDRVAPAAKRPTSVAFVVGSTMSSTTAKVTVGWPSATDDRTGIGAYGLQLRAGAGPWSTVVSATAGRSTQQTLRLSMGYGLRVRARDGAGNWGAWSATTSVTPVRYEETSTRVTWHGTWHRFVTSSSSGGTSRYTTSAGASVTFGFTGRAFAIVAPKGSSRGSARLYVDGVYVSTVDLHRASWTPRIVVAARSWSSSAAHTVRLVALGTHGHPRVDIDAFLVMR